MTARDDLLLRYVLRQGDRAIVLAQRLCEWVASAPELEEEMALANIGLDLLGQARVLFTYAAEIDNSGGTEDGIAFGRSDREYLSPLLVEQPNGDFACTMVRQLLHDAYAAELWRALVASTDERLAGLAAKVVKETAYHLRHSSTWVVRLGDGTDESHERAQRAVDGLWCYTGELFETDDVETSLAARGVAADPGALQPAWLERIEAVLDEATLKPGGSVYMQTGGRAGLHTEHMSYLLGEMQQLSRLYPGATW